MKKKKKMAKHEMVASRGELGLKPGLMGPRAEDISVLLMRSLPQGLVLLNYLYVSHSNFYFNLRFCSGLGAETVL